MDNTTTPLDAEIAAPEPNAPAMATQITPPSSITNGHTPPLGDEYGDGAIPADTNASIQGKGDGKGGWTPGFRARTAPERALKWERHFTEPGQDPFETVDWEMRTAGITGEDGKSVFEQTDCEIPKPWSQLATNVVVSKYFRGPIGSPQRETSVKQVIGRVADTIGLWGAQGGYFASDDDAENFRDELAYLLVNQYGAFNSPVWFNLGVKDARAQCSACFINDVYDDMESIMELAATEARLFKGGSGAGVNLWRIRSSREHLSGGGIASGPISFMRGWDSFAGAIKCLTPDAQVYTDQGLLRLDEIINSDLGEGFHADESVVVSTNDGARQISQVYVSPFAPTKQVELAHTGLRLRGTHEHPVLCLVPGFELKWKKLSEVEKGDRVAVSRSAEMWPEIAPDFSDFAPQTTWAKKTLTYPQTMTPELARLLGYMVSEGCMEAGRFRFCNADADVFADFLRCVEAVFGVDPSGNVRARVHPKTDVTTLLFEACWPNAVRFLNHIGLGNQGSADKRVPVSIRRSPREFVIEFLRAYFEGDGHVSNHVYASSASRGLLEEVQLLLLNMGMLPLLRRHPVNGKDGWNLYLRGDAAFRFVREVGFISARKQAAADVAGDKNTNIDTVPFLVDALRERTSKNGYFSCTDGETRMLGFGFFNRKAGSAISYGRLRQTPALLDNLEQVDPQLAETLEWVMAREYFWDTVVSVEETESAVTYDFTVPQTHSFVANGIVNHNSGGTCLAPHQRVYTAQGPVAVEELARREEFVALSFDPPANRYKAKRARAWLAGRKEVVRVTTDKGAFELSFDHPVKLSSGEYVQAGSLIEGMSLFACTIDTQHGHLRVGLRDGKKGKEFLHRLVAGDVMNEDLEGLVVHHRDGNPLNNVPENLDVMTQAEHAALHGREVAARGEHIFQTQEFSHAGADNGMHRDSEFWHSEAAQTYRETQGQILKDSGRASDMQREAARQKTLNTAFRVLNAGWPIDTFDRYARGRRIVIGRFASAVRLREQIEAEFGSHEEFVREVARVNHRVQSVETIGEMDVYDVEVQCPTPDDKSPQTGHNFLIWDGDEPTGSGVVVANTRRAAKMIILNADHPDIGEFITCKADEEKKAWALIEAGYNGGFNVPGGAYDSVDFQNANHSVRVTDEFMRAAENDGNWQLRAVTTGKVTDTKRARQMLKDIAETTWICGDPGMQFDTIINDWHTCSNTDRIYASNPCSEFMFLNSTACVTQETRVSTPQGLRKIVDLYDAQLRGEEVVITTEIAGEYDLRRLSAHRRAFVTQTGEREVFKISLADGRRVRATADHRFLTESGWKRVDQLKLKSDRLQLRQMGNTVAFTSGEAEVKRWQMLGWLTGDGVFSKDNVALVFGPEEAETARAMEDEFNHLISEARAYAGFEQEVAVSVGGERVVPELPRGGSHISYQANGVMQINSKSQSLVKYLEEWYGFKQGTALFKDVPSGLHEAPDDLKVAYLQGLFSADGCIRHDPRGRNARAEEVMLASSSPELLRSIQLILGDLGLTSRIGWTHPAGRANPQGQLHLYNQQGRNFMALIGFPCSPRKTEMAKEITARFFDANIQRPRPATVIAIEPDGIEMVYDLSEPVTHSFIAEGIVTHNCNLASLNLLKFYDMETGVFDAAGYSRACEIFITAQEIIVSFASYPTEKIGEMSEQYRPLGLGYANLGALLMAKGLAYDSDEGRALAGALTAIMTGAAYRKSAQIARNTGPFEGYAANKEPMLRVIAKHRDAVNRIDKSLVAENVMQEARNVWDDAYMSGQKYGYRNSQATVLAPTGCLVAGSLVSTDKGLVRMERLGNPDGEVWQEADFRVYTDDGVQSATKFFINGVDQTRVITTRAGYAIQGTDKHRVKVVNAKTGVWEWKHFRDLTAGDLLPLAMNTLIGEAQTVTLPPLGQLHWNGEWNTKTPAHMTAELAELVGYFMGDGSLHAKGLRFCVAQDDRDVAARLAQLGRELFGLEAHQTQQKGYIEVMLSSVFLAHWWDAAGFTKAKPNEEHFGKGYVPRVPDAVLHSNDAEVYGAFLRGLFEADGTNTLGVPSVSTAHKSFADEIRSLLLALGFPTSSKVDTSQWGNSDLHVQRLRNGSYNPRWLQVIGFMGARKIAGVVELKGALSGKRDRVFLPRAVWEELVPTGHPLRSAMIIALKRHGGVARQLAAQIHAQTGDERVAHILNYFFDEVESNRDGGEQMTYDLSVPANVTYVANGFVSHNTISFMMDCDTTGVEPDIALVKYKKLVGGGLLKIVNQTVPAALRNLGYDESEIKSIVDYIDKNDTIEGAPGLSIDHLPVFDCAFKAMNGTRSIHHMGHIKMMAATQPFISGAISKCVTGETLIATDKGIVPIASFYRGEKPGEFSPLAAKLASIGAPQDADLFYYGGNRPTIKATWADGRSIEGTPNHRVKVANAKGYDWKRLDALEDGDFVSVKLGANLWAKSDANLLEGFEASALYGCQKAIKLPAKMTPDLARFLGMYIAEGNMTRTNYMVRVTNLKAEVLSACERIVGGTFGIKGRVETDARNGVTSWVCASKSLCEFLTHIGAGGDSSSKQIPWSVLQSSETCVREFVGGLWLDGYVRQDGMTAICLNSPELLRQLQVVLNNFGLRAQLIRKYNKVYDKYFHELGLHGTDSRRFSELFRLDDAHKTAALQKLRGIAKKVNAVHSDVIPAFRAEIQAFIRAKHDTAQFRSVFDPRTKHLSWHTVKTIADFYGEEFLAAIPDLREILANNIHFVALREIEEGYAPVYDFQVPTNHAFLGNGMINHNTVNMPQDCTADEIYDAYLQAWKMGVKAVAIYRDGSKRTQPLSTASDAQKAEKKEGEIRRAARRKLPDERNSITHKFSIAGQEGYFMVGLYEDGSPGEIFIKMSKEGSTISGLMDSFAVAVSMCLQYGVPLRVLVNKFSHTRFEPSGYTTNRDIPIAKSLMDYIFRWFDLKFHPNGDNGHLGKTDGAPKAIAVASETSLFESGDTDNHGNVGNAQREVSQMQQDAPPCPDCGALTVRSGACYKCNECGATTGCG